MSNDLFRARVRAIVGGTAVFTVLVGCNRTTATPPSPPVGASTQLAEAPDATEVPDVETTLTLRFDEGRQPNYASVKPARMDERISKEWNIRDGHEFELEGPEGYELLLVFEGEANASERDSVYFVVNEPGPVTLEFQDGRVLHGRYAWGTVWPSRRTITEVVEREGLWDAWKNDLDIRAVTEMANPDNSSTKADRAALREAIVAVQAKWRTAIEAIEDDLLREVMMVHHLNRFIAIATPPSSRSVPRALPACSDCLPLMAQFLAADAAGREAFLPADQLAWVFEELPLDHEIWGARSGILLSPLVLFGEAEMGERVDDIADTTSYEGLRLTLDQAKSAWAGVPESE